MKIEVNTYSYIFKKFCPFVNSDFGKKISFVSPGSVNKNLIYHVFKDLFNIELVKINILRKNKKNNNDKKVFITFKTPNDFRGFVNTLKHHLSTNKNN